MLEKIIKFFKKEPKTVFKYVCPQCGHDNLGYFSTLSNFVQVVRDAAAPEYVQTIKCPKCGFTVDSVEKLRKL